MLVNSVEVVTLLKLRQETFVDKNNGKEVKYFSYSIVDEGGDIITGTVKGSSDYFLELSEQIHETGSMRGLAEFFVSEREKKGHAKVQLSSFNAI